MTYGTATTGSSNTPVKDLMAALKAPLIAGGFTFVETYASPAYQGWNGVAYGNGLFVAIAANATTVATSPDGITWTQRPTPAPGYAWSCIAYGGGKFVMLATNANQAAISTDGITWTVSTGTLASSSWSSIVYGGTRFVAIPTSGAGAAYSTDGGNTWPGSNGLPSASPWGSVAYGAGRFAVILNAPNTSAASSTDGVTWTGGGGRSTAATVYALTYGAGAGRFVGLGYGVNVLDTSTDGIAWTQQTTALPVVANWRAVAYGNGTYVAVAPDSPVALTSPDGLTWTARPMLTAGPWRAIAYGNTAFVATPSSGTHAAVTADGVTWSSRALPGTSSSPTADVYKSAAAGNAFGADWYLILRRFNDADLSLAFQVAEGYDPVNHVVSNTGGQGGLVAPVPGSYAYPGAPAAPDVAINTLATVAWAGSTSQTYWYSITRDRVIVGTKTSTSEGFYAGLYEDLLPAGTTQFPLVCLAFPTTQALSIGGNSGSPRGGFTREPGQQAVNSYNFSAAAHNGFWTGPSGNGLYGGGFTPMTTVSALYGNAGTLSRVPVGSMRSAAQTIDAYRGLLIGCVACATSGASGDTITVGGKTYTRIAGAAATYGYFVDQGL